MARPADETRCYFALRSPYSRLGLHRLARAGVGVRLIPFTGPPEGIEFNDPTRNRAKSAYYVEDLIRLCTRLGLPLALPDPFDVDFDLANRAILAAQAGGAGLALALALSDARWGEGRNLADPKVIAATAAAAGLALPAPEALRADAALTAELAEGRRIIEADQVFGVPFIVWNGHKYWGQDRIDLFLEDRAARG
ncbi:MAG: DsbA family protein [Alphaproteobacteria bacterium]|nr:DsbA family protein [Alphaproteobacteria bacterium]